MLWQPTYEVSPPGPKLDLETLTERECFVYSRYPEEHTDETRAEVSALADKLQRGGYPLMAHCLRWRAEQ